MAAEEVLERLKFFKGFKNFGDTNNYGQFKIFKKKLKINCSFYTGPAASQEMKLNKLP